MEAKRKRNEEEKTTPFSVDLTRSQVLYQAAQGRVDAISAVLAGRAKIVVMLHPEGEESAAEQKVAAITGIETLGGGAKVSKQL